MNRENETVRILNREFKCGISCEKVCHFPSPDYDTEYVIDGKKYVGYQTLQAEKTNAAEEKHGCECDRISEYQDSYGNQVILLIQDIPCFDSGDREYDRYHLLYFFHNAGKVHALYCGEGYRIATLTLFENVRVFNPLLKHYLKSKGFPV